MGHTIPERLAEFYRRLQAAPAATSAEEALQQLGLILDEVEDELSGVPRSSPPPGPGMFDGRMYPPMDDHVLREPSGAIVAITRGHVIEIESDGRIRITDKRTGTVEFVK